MERTIRGYSAAWVAALAWVYGPVLLKPVVDLHSSSRVALVLACAVLVLAWRHVSRLPSRPGQWRHDLMACAWGMVILGGAPALLVGGLLRTDAVSVALIGGLFVFVVPAVAWLRGKAELDTGFPVAFVLAAGGIYALLHGRVGWAGATISGNLLLGLGALLLVLGTMRAPLSVDNEGSSSRTNVVRISGAALFFLGLAVAAEFNWVGLGAPAGLPLPAMLATAAWAYWGAAYWGTRDFDWQAWPILPLAALLPVSVVLGTAVFVETLDLGEVITIGVVTIIMSSAHWLRRWLRSCVRH